VRLSSVFLTLAIAASLQAQPAKQAAPASNPGPNDVEVIHVRGNVYMFASDAGNVVVQVGEYRDNDGVLMVDTGSKETAPKILAELKKLTPKPLKYVVLTSPDAHHVAGNDAIAKPGVVRDTGGPQGAQTNIYAQDNALTRMSAPEMKLPDYALPTITYDRTKDFTFNGEAVMMYSVAPAHTDGDSIVYFRGSDVIAAGDVFVLREYPRIDLARGGSIQGEVLALNRIIDIAVPELTQEGGTMIIPGHGRICDEADVVEYRDMVTIVRDRVADYIKQGKTLEQTKDANLTLDYDGFYAKPDWTGPMFVEAIYKSLKSEGKK
jgi:cyclase